MDNDAARYRRFLDGDDNGLREIIDEHYSGLTLYINSMINDVSQTEEVLQDTFVKLAIKKPKYNGKSSFKTWLYAIARNYALNYLKRYRSRFSDKDIDEYYDIADENDIESEYIQSEQHSELHRALRTLKPEYAQVLYLMYFEQFDTENIAKVMHKTKKQVGDLLYRAKQSLKTKLEKGGFSYEEL